MAGITWWNFYVRVFPGSIKAPQIIEFLTHLLRHLRRPLLVIWDGLPGHRSRDVRDFVRAHDDRLTLEVLPGYAPHSIRSNIFGAISNNTNSRTSVRASCGNSATPRVGPCAVCAAGRRWCARSGNKPVCLMNVTSVM